MKKLNWDIELTHSELDEIERSVIIDFFCEDNKIRATAKQKRAMMRLIKDSAEWGRRQEKKQHDTCKQTT